MNVLGIFSSKENKEKKEKTEKIETKCLIIKINNNHYFRSESDINPNLQNHNFDLSIYKNVKIISFIKIKIMILQVRIYIRFWSEIMVIINFINY